MIIIPLSKKHAYDNKRAMIVNALNAFKAGKGDAIVANTKYELEQTRIMCAKVLHLKSVQQKQYSGGWLVFPVSDKKTDDATT